MLPFPQEHAGGGRGVKGGGRGREVITFRKWISHTLWEERLLLESPRDRFTFLSEGPSRS